MNDISDTEKESPWADPDAPAASDPVDTEPEADSTSGESAKTADVAPIDDIAALAAAVEQDGLKSENADLREKLLLTVADMENLRRRTEREKQDAGKYAVSRFAQDVLSISDNLTRAIASIDEETRTSAAEGITNLIAGVEMTERELQNVLSRHGITQLSPKGEKFDPNFHQAIFEVENPDVPSGTVMEIVQAGYTISDRVLRPAMVGVSKGGPKAGAAPAPAAEPDVDTDTDADTDADTVENATESAAESTTETTAGEATDKAASSSAKPATEAAGPAAAYADPLETVPPGDSGDDAMGHSVDKNA